MKSVEKYEVVNYFVASSWFRTRLTIFEITVQRNVIPQNTNMFLVMCTELLRYMDISAYYMVTIVMYTPLRVAVNMV